VKVDPDQLEEVRITLLDHEFTYPRKSTNQYEDFRIEFSGGVIVGYTSGKIVANNLESANLLQSVVKGMVYKSDFEIIVGSDEAGKGEWLGPLTVAAVALSPEQANQLRSSGVMDSKELTVAKIGELAFEIEAHSLAYYIVVISPEKFDQKFNEFHEEGKNLNDLLAWAHAKAISEVFEILGALGDARVLVVVDEFSAKKLEERLSKVVDLDSVELIQRPRAEDNPSVAAASIMARDAREDWIDKASFRLGVELASMTLSEARTRSNAGLFSKTVYFKK